VAGVGLVGLDLWSECAFWPRIMISGGFEAVNTVFGGYFGFGKKKRSLRERDVVKHGPYTAPLCLL
jgi:hypothetical protein